MTDRRQIPDRRSLPTRPHGSGRRESDAEPVHGSRARYRKGCRCTPCKAASADTRRDEYSRRQRHGALLGHYVSATATNRRLRLLLKDGYTLVRLAQMLGLQRLRIAHGRGARVRRKTAAKVKRLYRQLIASPEVDTGEKISTEVRDVRMVHALDSSVVAG